MSGSVIKRRRKTVLKSLKRQNTISVLMLGDKHVGKTSLINCWLDSFTEEYIPTVENYILKECVFHGLTVNVGIIDIAGSCEFPSMDQLYIKRANIIVLVYEVGNERSLKSLKRYAENIRKEIGEKDIVMCVAGTKSDQTTGSDHIPNDYFQSLKVPPHFKTSAKHNINIREMFDYLMGKVVHNVMCSSGKCQLTVEKHEKCSVS